MDLLLRIGFRGIVDGYFHDNLFDWNGAVDAMLGLMGIVWEEYDKVAVTQLNTGSGVLMAEKGYIAVGIIGGGAVEIIDMAHQNLLLSRKKKLNVDIFTMSFIADGIDLTGGVEVDIGIVFARKLVTAWGDVGSGLLKETESFRKARMEISI